MQYSIFDDMSNNINTDNFKSFEKVKNFYKNCFEGIVGFAYGDRFIINEIKLAHIKNFQQILTFKRPIF